MKEEENGVISEGREAHSSIMMKMEMEKSKSERHIPRGLVSIMVYSRAYSYSLPSFLFYLAIW